MSNVFSPLSTTSPLATLEDIKFRKDKRVIAEI